MRNLLVLNLSDPQKKRRLFAYRYLPTIGMTKKGKSYSTQFLSFRTLSEESVSVKPEWSQKETQILRLQIPPYGRHDKKRGILLLFSCVIL